MAGIEVPEVDYTEYTNRQLAAVPLAVLALALAVIGAWMLATGAPANLGLEFTGGTEVRVAMDDVQDDATARERIRSGFSAEPTAIQSVADGVYVVTFGPEADTGRLDTEAKELGELRAIDQVSASFGGDTQRTAVGGVVVAFLGMSVLVFAMFRSIAPSVAIVASAFSDIVVPVAVMNLLNIELTLGTVAALLMLIGYSVDSDILLNNSVLRRTGSFYESVNRAMRTGVTMTVTSIAAMVVMTLVATAFGIDLLANIGLILVVGLCTDLMNTYLLNVSLLRWYKFEGVAR